MESNKSDEDTLYSEVGNFYLNNDKLHDVTFIVGEQKEKITAVKLPLINQSRPWWSMLSEDSPLAEKDEINLPDIDPEVFLLVLKHSYGGLENLDDLSDDFVEKLCYCANKYFMKSLMTKIAARLGPKDVDSVFPALHCLTYYNLHGVEDSVKKIVQTRATKIFEHPKFLECDVDSVTYICKQDTLDCDEITLWKAVVSWAKHKAGAEDGNPLRQWMSEPLKHIRLLTLSRDDIWDQVFTLGVLSGEEMSCICSGIKNPLPSICSESTARSFVDSRQYSVKRMNVIHSRGKFSEQEYSSSSTVSIVTNKKSIFLESVTFRGYLHPSNLTSCKNDLYIEENTVDIVIKVVKITDPVKNTSGEFNPVTISVKCFKHFCFDCITIPTVIDNKGVPLQANSRYNIEINFSTSMPCWQKPNCVNGHSFEHGSFFCSLGYIDGVGATPCHIIQFAYKVAED